jgi:biopolymer transport protein ExbB/TolQ
VSRRSDRNGLLTIISALGWPMLLGAAATSMFYVLVFRGPLDMPLMHRYFASHPVALVATCMFFVGMAALALKMIEVMVQYWSISNIRLDEAPSGGQSVADVPGLLEKLTRLPESAQKSYLGRRLHDALQFVQRQGDAAELNEELKYLADMDAGRQHDSFALVRIITWATPMLGFLGTVIGITQALGDLDANQLATDIQGAMDGLLSGLYVAFDTTALALSLSIVLMFVMFAIDRLETQLLAQVDSRINETLIGRFQQVGGGHDPYLNSIGRMCQTVVEATETLVERQTELWRQSFTVAQQQWTQAIEGAGKQVQTALHETLQDALGGYAERMARLEGESADRVQQRWQQLQAALVEHARLMQAQQRELMRQGEIMTEVVQATGEVITLEKSLNENLKTLAGAKNFEETVMSLSAAIHLMSVRLGSSDQAPQVDLKHSRNLTSKERAA